MSNHMGYTSYTGDPTDRHGEPTQLSGRVNELRMEEHLGGTRAWKPKKSLFHTSETASREIPAQD